MKPDRAILCVDDEAIILLAMKQELMGEFGDEYVIETALNAKAALEIIDELSGEGVRIILIISDWLMPETKGDVFLARVKAARPDVRCIIISGHADDEAIEIAKREVRLDAFIKKPWSHEDLVNAVRTCVGCLDRPP